MYIFTFIFLSFFGLSSGWSIDRNTPSENATTEKSYPISTALTKSRTYFNKCPQDWAPCIKDWNPSLSSVDETKTHDSPIDLNIWKAKFVRWAEKWPKAKLTQYIETTTRMFNALLEKKKMPNRNNQSKDSFHILGKKPMPTCKK